MRSLSGSRKAGYTGETTRVLGVDGCPGEWIGALVTAYGDIEWELFADVRGIVSVDASATGIDVPVGLADNDARDCDVTARQRLRPYGSRVFPAPIRTVAALPPSASYAHACAVSRSVHARQKALSRQTWNILGKIREVDAMMTPQLQVRIIEVHPEVSFAALAGRPLEPKRTPAGQAERLQALRAWRRDPEEAIQRVPRPARADDALDALAAAWSAGRWLRGEAYVLPTADPPRDEYGLRMEIVA